jgi:hypothetical protein
MAFGRDFGRIAQGDNKTGQKGMNAMFVVTHDKIALTLAAKKRFAYGTLFSITDHMESSLIASKYQWGVI